jgi:ABC-2 type transport system ATP-binding protein
MANLAAIEIHDLRVVRGGWPAVNGVSFDVPAGQVTGLLGPSGSGKTSLMRAVVGVQIVESGTVTVLGVPAGSKALRSRLGYVTQSPSVYDDLTVLENLTFFCRVLGAPLSTVAEVVDAVDLGDHRGTLVARLSGGERSRVNLAAALLGSPEVLVLDEPTVGLDPVLRRDLWALFHRLADRGVTLLVSSHVMDEAERCDRLILMRAGRVVADEPLPDLLARTGTGDVEAAFLAIVDDEGRREEDR